jgi:tRNA A37 threonylcarbamoyladenosine modification protein TsaB
MNKKITLGIDARDAKKTVIELVSPSLHETLVHEGTNTHSQVVLPLIENALKKHGCILSDIVAIEVRVDHGSFTGRRVGAVLGSLLHVPVNGASAETPIEIPYEEDKWK